MTVRRRWLLPAAVGLVLAACAGPAAPSSSPSPSTAPSASTPVLPSVDPSVGASAAPSASADVPEPGQPFDADAVLRLMRESRRPGGVPELIQTAEVAGQVAAMLWTIDGRPWEVGSAGASCHLGSCTLELAGRGPAMSGEDVWTFDVARGPVALVSADLHALPPGLAERLDEAARAGDDEGLLEGLIATSARWLPPPDDGRFLVAYRSGDEEGSCAREATVDLASGEVEISEATGC